MIMNKEWERGKSVFLAFLDLKNSWIQVPGQELWIDCFGKINIPQGLADAIKSTYYDSKETVRTNGR